MTHKMRQLQSTPLRHCRILFTWGLCMVLLYPTGWRGIAEAQQQTPQQQQQQREEQQREQQERQQQQREQQEQREQQQREQQEQRQQQQQQREEQQRQQQEQQREQQERQQQVRQQREQQQRQQQEEQQRQEQQRQQQEQQQRQEQQRQQQEQQQRQEQQHEQQQREQQRRAPASSPSEDPVLKHRPVDPEPIRPEPAHGPERAPSLPDRQFHPPLRPTLPGLPPDRRPDSPDRPVRGPEHLPTDTSHPVRPNEPTDPLRLPAPRPHPVNPLPVVLPRPTVIVRPRATTIVVPAPSTTEILSLGPRPRVVVGAPPAANLVATPQQFTSANSQLNAAEATCAQANAYQNYVTNLVNRQNAVGQTTDQILQGLADFTTDPNLQQALTNSIGQPNPINDALQQQLQNMADSYQNVCQTQMAAAQGALSAASPQASGPAPIPATGSSFVSQQSNSNFPPIPPPASDSGQSIPSIAAQASAPQTGQCPAVAATNLPAPDPQWGPWVSLGNTGLAFDLSRLNDRTTTWRFVNAGTNTISSMQFTYSYIDAGTGLAATQSNVLLFTLAPGQTVGGGAPYTANTTGNITITITQISCQ
jgi:hypothetical protein